MSYRNPFQEKLRQLDQELKKNMVGMKPLPHHSSGDWDFATANWILDAATFVSAPSSLHFTEANNNTLIKTTTVPIANLKQGRFISQIRSSAEDAYAQIVFRYQDDDNCYYLHTCCNIAANNTIIRRVGGVNATLRTGTVNWLPVNTWRRIRITWWNDYVGIVIRAEYWDGDAWTNIMLDAYDAPNHWATIGGRLGMGDFTDITSDFYWYDDTFIYGLPP